MSRCSWSVSDGTVIFWLRGGNISRGNQHAPYPGTGDLLIRGVASAIIFAAELLAEGAGEVSGEMARIRELGTPAVDATWGAVAEHARVVFDGRAPADVILRVVWATADWADHRCLGEAAAIDRVSEAVAPVTLSS